MRKAWLLLSVLIGIGIGLGLTSLVVQRGIAFDVVRLGPWEFVPRAGSSDMSPYRRTRLFVDGELPLASGEGYALTARHDPENTVLSGRCRYRVTGPVAPARFWTLTLTTPEGNIVANAAERYGFTSAEILRETDGHFSIEIGPDPLAGNWLPSKAGQDFVLTFRFYETPLSATATLLDARAVPVLSKTGCTA